MIPESSIIFGNFHEHSMLKVRLHSKGFGTNTLLLLITRAWTLELSFYGHGSHLATIAFFSFFHLCYNVKLDLIG